MFLSLFLHDAPLSTLSAGWQEAGSRQIQGWKEELRFRPGFFRHRWQHASGYIQRYQAPYDVRYRRIQCLYFCLWPDGSGKGEIFSDVC